MNRKRPLAPKVPLHPASIHHLKKGNPWITADEFSNNFPKKDPFLIGTDQKGHPLAVLLNDPEHPQVKARVWSLKSPLEEQIRLFPTHLKERISKSIHRREEILQENQRDNVCLVHEESDELPGLQILKLKDLIYIKLYSSFWPEYKNHIMEAIDLSFKDLGLPRPLNIIAQLRGADKNTPKNFWRQSRDYQDTFTIQEFGVNYELRLEDHYDYGIYTDMSGLRLKLKRYFEDSKVLNLYCYTGAFSLYALSQGASAVDSVDLSPNYLSWLGRNLELNPELDHTLHKSHEAPCDRFLKRAEDESYDLIIVDPPSASSDGKKVQNALQQYEKIFADLNRTLSPDGHLILALNTHKISMNKFEGKIRELINGLPLKIIHTFVNCDDFHGLKTLPDSRYLKILVLHKS